MIVNCETCNKEFNKLSSEINRNITGNHFCSVKCYNVYIKIFNGNSTTHSMSNSKYYKL